MTLRPTPAQLAPSAVITVLCVAVVWWALAWWVAVAVLIVGALALARDWAGVRLTADGARLRTLFGSRAVAWEQVRRIDAPGTRVILATSTGTVGLPAPRKGIAADPDFDAKLATVRSYWQSSTSD